MTYEIDGGKTYMELTEAQALVAATIAPLAGETIAIEEAQDRVLVIPVRAVSDSPSVTSSLKDGFAVRSCQARVATKAAPLRLRIIGRAAAAAPFDGVIGEDETIAITTGAPLPHGTDAVIAEELCRVVADEVLVLAPTEPGQNVLGRGVDTSAGQIIAPAGRKLGPGMLGRLVSAGIGEVQVHTLPRVAIVAVGDELARPGEPLLPGQLYASNAISLRAWLARFGITGDIVFSGDDSDQLRSTLRQALSSHDAVLTAGGAWGSTRDAVLPVLADLGWSPHFHRVRLGPGKGVAYGTAVNGKPVFCLPGGPPSCEIAFLQLALGGLLRLSGSSVSPFLELPATSTTPIQTRDPSWTQCVYGRLNAEAEGLRVTPLALRSRLESMAEANALIVIPPGSDRSDRGALVRTQLLVSPNPVLWVN